MFARRIHNDLNSRVISFSNFYCKGLILILLGFLMNLGLAADLPPEASEDDPLLGRIMDSERLLAIAEREQDLIAAISRPEGRLLDEETLLREAQSIITLYERYLNDYPNDPTALLLYSKFLMIVGRPYEAGIILLRLDEERPNLPVVKQQLGNLAAEEGDFLEALTWFREAIRLSPLEPTYHFQKGVLLDTFREQFIEANHFSRSELDNLMLNAFREASELAPQNRDLKARLAEAFYDLEEPDWNEALKLWKGLAQHPLSETEDQVISLHLARVLAELKRASKAREYLERVTHPALEESRRITDSLIRNIE